MMKREEIQHLLGGYAAGTLTPSEQQLLFSAAMEDQALFDALADEQALKEILDDPESRGFLRAALEEVAPKPEPEKKQRLSWWWPAAGSLVAASLALLMILNLRTPAQKQQPKATTVAVNLPGSAKGDIAPQAPKTSGAPVAPAAPATPAKPAAPEPKPVVRAAAQPEEVKAKKEVALDSTTSTATTASKDAVADKKAVAAAAAGPADAAAERPREAESRKAATPPVQVAAAPPPPAGTAQGQIEKRAAEPQQIAQTALSASQLYLAQAQQNQAPASAAAFRAPRFAAPAPTTSRDTERRSDARQQQPQAAPEAAGRAASVGGGVITANSVGLRSQQNIGIRYQILRRNSQGQYVQTRLDTRFEAGDEIVIQVDKNAGGIVLLNQRPAGSTAASWTPVPMESQTLFEARTAPIRLAKGAFELSIVLSPDGRNENAPAAAGSRQISETSGNTVYVVVPGAATAPVATTLRILVN